MGTYAIAIDSALHEKVVWHANGRRDYQWKILIGKMLTN